MLNSTRNIIAFPSIKATKQQSYAVFRFNYNESGITIENQCTQAHTRPNGFALMIAFLKLSTHRCLLLQLLADCYLAAVQIINSSNLAVAPTNGFDWTCFMQMSPWQMNNFSAPMELVRCNKFRAAILNFNHLTNFLETKHSLMIFDGRFRNTILFLLNFDVPWTIWIWIWISTSRCRINSLSILQFYCSFILSCAQRKFCWDD